MWNSREIKTAWSKVLKVHQIAELIQMVTVTFYKAKYNTLFVLGVFFRPIISLTFSITGTWEFCANMILIIRTAKC